MSNVVSMNDYGGAKGSGRPLGVRRSLLLLIEAISQPWREEANCRGLAGDEGEQMSTLDATEVFYPGRSDGPEEIKRAKAVCAGCQVREECLEWALVHGEKIGVWGMTTGAERRILRREMLRSELVVGREQTAVSLG